MTTEAALQELKSRLHALERLLASRASGPPERKYRPDQPRIPAGESAGGQWVEGAGDGEPHLMRAAYHSQRRGRPGRYTHGELTGAVYNESSSLEGQGIDDARRALAHVAQNRLDAGLHGGMQDGTLSATERRATQVDASRAQRAYDSASAAAEHALSTATDPTDGAMYFYMRADSLPQTFEGRPLTGSFGPFINHDRGGALPPTNVYIGIYGGRRR